MAIPHARPAEPVDVRPLGPELAEARSTTLFKTESVETIRMVLAKGRIIADHSAPGDIIIHCIEGRIDVAALNNTTTLEPGHLLYLLAADVHSVAAIDDSSFLLTIVLK